MSDQMNEGVSQTVVMARSTVGVVGVVDDEDAFVSVVQPKLNECHLRL